MSVITPRVSQPLPAPTSAPAPQAQAPDRATNQADLVVADISFVPSQPREGSTARLVVTVENQGTAPAGAFDVSVSRDVSGTQRVSHLDPGARQALSFGPVRIPFGEQMMTIQADADTRNEVAESRDDNNWLIAFLPVGNPPAPPIPQPPLPPLPPLPVPPPHVLTAE